MALEDCWKQLQHVHETVRYADAKAGIILTLNGFLVGLVALRLQSSGFFAEHRVAAPGLVLAMALLAAGVGWDIAAVMPRQVTAGDRGALLHYARVAARFAGRPEAYIDEFVALAGDSELLQREIAAQVWANSVLARRKYRCILWGLRFLAAALGVALLATAAAAFGG